MRHARQIGFHLPQGFGGENSKIFEISPPREIVTAGTALKNGNYLPTKPSFWDQNGII